MKFATFTTDHVTPGQRSAFWREAVTAAYIPLEPEIAAARPFEGRISAALGTDLQLTHVSSMGHRVCRTRAGIARRSNDTFFAILLNEGRALLNQAERTAVARAGDILLVDTDQPFSIAFETRCDIICLSLAADALRSSLMWPETTMLSLQRSAAAAVARGYIRSLPIDDGLRELEGMATEQVSALIRRAMAQEAGRSLNASASLAVLLKRAIESNIQDPNLSAKTLCRHLSIARTTLFETLAADNMTLRGAIRERRLQGCLAEMRQRAASGKTLKVISEAWGFRDQATFSRVFRKRFGVAPTAFEQRHSQG